MKEQVDALVREGRIPLVTLSPGMEVRMPKQRPVRPTVRDPLHPWAHYATRRGKGRPRCAYRGCQHKLHVRDVGYCSATCADLAINHALYLLRSAGVTPEELTVLYGGEDVVEKRD